MESGWKLVPPNVAPVSSLDREDTFGHFEKPVDAVSFGFVATAILISMFLVMAIFERFLRPRSTHSVGQNRRDLESQRTVSRKLNDQSPNITTCGGVVSVLMPGEKAPTFIAHPAPSPCPLEGILQTIHEQNTLSKPTSSWITS